jgi:DNA-directed RNA polymerase specialized sigma24 family protein
MTSHTHYVRRRGYREVDAQDLTQDFFIRILEGW